MSDLADAPPALEDLTPPAPAGPAVEPGWKRTADGKREYTTREGKRGVIYRKEGETVAEAVARDQEQPKDQKPRRKPKTPRKPAPPKAADLKELEAILAEAFASPAMICAGFGDEWAANHFTNQGPYLARNLIRASEHNPWLRRKLEDAASGGDTAMKLISLVGVGGALFGYAAPVIIYWFNLPVPDKAREMFGIPEAREHGATAPATAP